MINNGVKIIMMFEVRDSSAVRLAGDGRGILDYLMLYYNIS